MNDGGEWRSPALAASAKAAGNEGSIYSLIAGRIPWSLGKMQEFALSRVSENTSRNNG